MASALQRVMARLVAFMLIALQDDTLCEEVWIPMATNMLIVPTTAMQMTTPILLLRPSTLVLPIEKFHCIYM